MSSQSRIELFQEAMNIEQERAALQDRLDQMLSRLSSIKGVLSSGGGSATALGVKPIQAVAAKAAPVARPRRAARGELKQRIFQTLAAAGKVGMRVRDLAVTLGSKPEALHSWFQFARKNIPAIRKAGKGRYRYVGPAPKTVPTPAKPKAIAKAARKPGKSSGNERGQLAARIQAALKAAGKVGVRVGDLAKAFAMNPRNLFVWFSTTGRKFKAIKKVAPGHYRLG
jgi:hypothetical protein